MAPAKEGGDVMLKEPHSHRDSMLSNVVLPFYEKLFAARIQHLENVLLENSLKPKIEVAA